MVAEQTFPGAGAYELSAEVTPHRSKCERHAVGRSNVFRSARHSRAWDGGHGDWIPLGMRSIPKSRDAALFG